MEDAEFLNNPLFVYIYRNFLCVKRKNKFAKSFFIQYENLLYDIFEPCNKAVHSILYHIMSFFQLYGVS